MNQREFQRKLQSIRSTERGITPDPAWVLRTRETLLMQVSNSLSAKPAPAHHQLREFWRRFVPTQWLELVRGPVFAVISILGIVAGGSIMSVSAAEQSLPGDFLYPIKLAGEQTQLIFTKSRSEKLKLKTGFVERRVKEIQAIASGNEPKKGERIKAAAETLRRDLDTVKNQLIEVSDNKDKEDSLGQVVEAAKLVDQKSTEVAATLKDVKSSLPVEAQGKVGEVETAAVATGVKALQVLIDSHDHPDAKGEVTEEDLSKSIQGKVDGLQDQITSATEKIISANNATTGTQGLLTASSTLLTLNASTSSAAAPLIQIKNAQQSLEEAKQSLQENKLSEVRDKLGDAAKSVSVAETVADATMPPPVPPPPVAAPTSTLPIPDSQFPIPAHPLSPAATTGTIIDTPAATSSLPSSMSDPKKATPGG